MQSRGQRHRASIPPVQMQWEHQARSPGLLNGVAVPLPEEVLRALQDPVSIYKTLRSKHATGSAHGCLYSPLYRSRDATRCDMAEVLLGGFCLVGLAPLCHTTDMETAILVQRWGLAIQVYGYRCGTGRHANPGKCDTTGAERESERDLSCVATLCKPNYTCL